VSVDPQTPVIVGVAQVTVRPGEHPRYEDRPTPLSLMTSALRGAADDSGAGRAVLDRLEELVAVGSFTWHPRDPARLVADELSLQDVRTRLTPTGGNLPQLLVHESARRIERGELEAVAVVGAEAMYARALAQREGRRVDWVTQGEEVPTPELVGEDRIPFTEEEYRQGLTLPIDVYPLFENARRARRDWSITEHRARVGRLWANFAQVAAANPHGWLRDAPTAEAIITPSPTNRMVAFPYTKLLVANQPVDMGAAFIMTSVELARTLGVADELMVFPQTGADANDHWFVSERPVLDDSPAMAAIWRSLRDVGVDADSLAHIDLYSCFPTVVQTACDVLGLDPLDESRVPTVTGGLTFGGGPGNNYVTHSIATMVERLRDDPTSQGLLTALGWFSTKHAWGTYATSPPPTGFRWRNAQSEVDALPRATCLIADGAVTVETYTVTHERDGSPRRLIAAALRDDGQRVWCHSLDPALATSAETEELIGRRANVRDGVLTLS
jgi:acetyl-CoA C-acetyltransferase